MTSLETNFIDLSVLSSVQRKLNKDKNLFYILQLIIALIGQLINIYFQQYFTTLLGIFSHTKSNEEGCF